MGIDDRDYMPERIREPAGQTRWHDKRFRVEAAWLNPHKSYRHRALGIHIWLSALLWGIGALLLLISHYSDFQRESWILDLQTGEPFPETGPVAGRAPRQSP